MDRLNRVILAALAVVVAAGAALYLAAAAGLWVPPPGLGRAVGEALAAALVSPTPWGMVLGVALLLTALVALVVAVGPRAPREVLVSESPEGDVTVALGTVREFVERTVERLSDVRRAVASVHPKPDGLWITCHVEANASAILDALGEEIRRAVHDEVAAHLCLEVRRVEVKTRMSLHRRARTVVK